MIFNCYNVKFEISNDDLPLNQHLNK